MPFTPYYGWHAQVLNQSVTHSHYSSTDEFNIKNPF